MNSGYPKRDRCHAHRITRLLFKSCAAQTLGHQAVCLVVHVAHTEDASRYQGPVRFWNSQLMETLGFKSPKQLTGARSKAVEAGWLYYERSNDRSVGHYWTLIPVAVTRFDDQPIEPISHSILHSDSRSDNGKHSDNGKDMFSESGTHSGMHCGTRSGKPSNPYPFPYPNTSSTNVDGVGVKRKQKNNRREYTSAFEQWWNFYPRKAAKPAAARHFAAAVAQVQDEHHLTQQAALDWLVEQTKKFADAKRDTPIDLIPHPATWLNQDRFNDLEPSQGGSNSDPYADLEYIQAGAAR